MADFLTNLAGRALSQRPVVRPNFTPLFAPGPSFDADPTQGGELDSEVESASPRDTEAPAPSRPSPGAARAQGSLTRVAPSAAAANDPHHDRTDSAHVSASIAPMRPKPRSGPEGETSMPGKAGSALETTPAVVASAIASSPEPALVDARPAPAISASPPQNRHRVTAPPRISANGRAMLRPSNEQTAAPQFDNSLPPRSRRDGVVGEGSGVDAAPAIQVTIGRVDVRLVSTPAAAPARPVTAAPRLTLAEYLGTRQDVGR